MEKLFYLVPARYWNIAGGVIVASLLAGIGSTLFFPSSVRKKSGADSAAPLQAEVDTLLIARKNIQVPASISRGNIFRAQRRDYEAPPPPKPVIEEKEEIAPDIKLVGIIISGDSRIAIVDSKITGYKKRKTSPNVFAPISGAITKIKRPDSMDEGFTPYKTEELESQSFHEGDYISDFILERVLEDRIEVTSPASGKRTVIHLKEEPPKALASTATAALSPNSGGKKEPEPATPSKANISGAVTKSR